MSSVLRTRRVKELAVEAGFSRVGIATAAALDEDRGHMQAWLNAGMHGQMHWLANNIARRCDPAEVVENARSVIMLALDYDSDAPRSIDADVMEQGRGWISRYAWGDDYHRVIERRLKAFTQLVEGHVVPSLGEDFRGANLPLRPWSSRLDFRYYVDHGPVLERAWAERAGLGWRGRHGLVVHPAHGSFFFLAAVITSIPLDADAPVTDHCGSCTACVDACPTDAIVASRSVDSRKCISYVSIEASTPLQDADAALLGGHVFGCDICQDVCPFNRFSEPGDPAFAPRPGTVAPGLQELIDMSDDVFRSRFKASAVRRRKPGAFRHVAAAAQRHGWDERRLPGTSERAADG